MLLRCTVKLLKASGHLAEPTEEPLEGSWHCNLLWLRGRKCLLATHTQTLYCVVVVDVLKSDLVRMGETIRSILRESLLHEGLGQAFEILAAGEVRYAKTTSRSVLGTMTDAKFMLEAYYEGIVLPTRQHSLPCSSFLNQTPRSQLPRFRSLEAVEDLVASETRPVPTSAKSMMNKPLRRHPNDGDRERRGERTLP